jgi:hypothetical protein
MVGSAVPGPGMAGQITYHLLAGAGVTRAPWAITTIVSCLPVLVLAMGTTLAHLLRDDAAASTTAGDRTTGQPDCWSSARSPEDQARTGPDRAAAGGPAAPEPPAAARPPAARVRPAEAHAPRPDPQGGLPAAEQARLVARRLAAAGKPVSRRALRRGGIRGSNEALGELARELNAEL